MILRSMMFVPGHNEKLMISASRSAADALILDIEDSVMPPSNKEVARGMIRRKVSEGLFDSHTVFIRINDRDSGHFLKDLQELTISGICGFVYPKATSGDDIYFFDKLLYAVEVEKGIPTGTFKIVPLIETAAAVVNVDEICSASSRVIAVAFGCEDFVADLGGIHTKGGESLFVPRAMISLAARANGVIPIDTVHVDVHNMEDLKKNLKLARELGFEGMLVLHPKEIDIVHRYFTPSREEVDEAKEMLRLYQTAQELGKGVAVLEGRFIGPPMVAAAKKILERHKLIEEALK